MSGCNTLTPRYEFPTGSRKNKIYVRRDAIMFIFIILQYFKKNYEMICYAYLNIVAIRYIQDNKHKQSMIMIEKEKL